MSPPKTASIDKYITYPMINHLVPYLSWLHPTVITLIGIGSKVKALTLLKVPLTHPYLLCFWMVVERLLDCLDGAVARYYQKNSRSGHYLDKYSDLIYRLGMIALLIMVLTSRPTYSITWVTILILLVGMPLVYLFDYNRYGFNPKMETLEHGWSIFLEDNAMVVSVIVPLLLYDLSK